MLKISAMIEIDGKKNCVVYCINYSNLYFICMTRFEKIEN